MIEEKSEKEKLFESWNDIKHMLDASSIYNEFLKGLRDENNELYKFACSLTEIYKNAHIQQEKCPNICEFLNEWLNNKKRIHTDNGNDAKNNHLWESYIERLWIHLEGESERNYWCSRIIPSSPYSTIRSCLHAYTNNKIRLKQNLHEDISNGLLRISSKCGDIYAGNKRITLSYHSS
ncbi:PIR Superfamily Protein [Plasmodium ovale curtisi]|uniref:PIR Superfamily Protein n=1 Tax=Plasmodium ovale curtisi TaxID=864141 RepID=A0A1A8XAN1_PLAOA|nr:PIR Superfamily Protein [Plasmodium ovale curtisi]